MVRLVREGRPVFLGRFVVEEDGQVKTLTYEEYAARTGMKYLWANDALYWDWEATGFPAHVKRPFLPGGDWRSFKPRYESMRRRLREYHAESGSLGNAVLRVLEEDGEWYAGYNFQWPVHGEPAEAPDVELALEYPSLAWLNKYNVDALARGAASRAWPSASSPEDPPGELVVVTSHRLTEHFHSGAMTRNVPYLAELVPEPYAQIPEPLAQKLGIKSGDHITIETARGTIKMRALVTKGTFYAEVNGKPLPVISLQWAFSFLGLVTGPQANFLSPDVVDVKTTIQESKAWVGKVRRAE